LICIDSDTFFHGANCIKEALDQCLYEINQETIKNYKQFLISSAAAAGAGVGGGIAGSFLRVAPFIGSVGKIFSSQATAAFEPKLLVNSFSDDLPDRFQEEEEATKSETKEKAKPSQSLKNEEDLTKENELGILETFNNDPLKAKVSVLSSHNWTVSKNTHIVWIGHLAWQQVTSIKAANLGSSSSSLTFPSSFTSSSSSHYPYPISSLLSVATKKNSELKLLQKKFKAEEKVRGKHNGKSTFSSGKKKNYAICQSYSDVITLPEYLINVLKENIEIHSISSKASFATPVPHTPATSTFIPSITHPPSHLPLRDTNITSDTDVVIVHPPHPQETLHSTNFTSTASKMKSMLRPVLSYFSFSNDSHNNNLKIPIDSTLTNITTATTMMMKHVFNSNITQSSLFFIVPTNITTLSKEIRWVFNNASNPSLFSNTSTNSSSLTYGMFNNNSHPIFSNLSSSSLSSSSSLHHHHRLYPSRYHYHNESISSNISSLVIRSSMNSTERRQRRKLLFSLSSSSSSSSSKHQIPKIFTTKSRMRTNKTSYSFSLSSLSLTLSSSSESTSVSHAVSGGGCTPSIFLIGFLSTSYASYISNSLISHPSILTGYDGLINDVVDQQQQHHHPSFYDKGCYNLLSEEVSNSPSQASLLKNRASCYPMVEKN
jgi:hypothetical protein